ncbi:hypothetical protein [Roseococcus suduntuyensis]|nr:hypothetical protein [Roseococcus suduntuyensis]
MFAAPAAASADPDARLLALLIETRAAHAAIVRAYNEAEDMPADAVLAPLYARLDAARDEMAATPARGVLGALAKAARIADNLSDNGSHGEPGYTLDCNDAPVGASLAADLARLLPVGVQA